MLVKLQWMTCVPPCLANTADRGEEFYGCVKGLTSGVSVCIPAGGLCLPGPLSVTCRFWTGLKSFPKLPFRFRNLSLHICWTEAINARCKEGTLLSPVSTSHLSLPLLPSPSLPSHYWGMEKYQRRLPAVLSVSCPSEGVPKRNAVPDAVLRKKDGNPCCHLSCREQP